MDELCLSPAARPSRCRRPSPARILYTARRTSPRSSARKKSPSPRLHRCSCRVSSADGRCISFVTARASTTRRRRRVAPASIYWTTQCSLRRARRWHGSSCPIQCFPPRPASSSSPSWWWCRRCVARYRQRCWGSARTRHLCSAPSCRSRLRCHATAPSRSSAWSCCAGSAAMRCATSTKRCQRTGTSREPSGRRRCWSASRRCSNGSRHGRSAASP